MNVRVRMRDADYVLVKLTSWVQVLCPQERVASVEGTFAAVVDQEVSDVCGC